MRLRTCSGRRFQPRRTFPALLGLIEHSIGKPALNADWPAFSWYVNLRNSPKPLRSAMLQKGRI